MWKELAKEFFYDLRTHRLRATLTLVAIAWGTLSVVFLMAFASGFGTSMERGLTNAGNAIFIIYGGETGKVHDGLPMGRRIRLTEDDVEFLKQNIPDIIMASPQYRKNVVLQYGRKQLTTECEGAGVDFEEMRTMYPVEGGRFLNSQDVAQRRRALYLGSEIAQELTGEANPVGKSILVDGIPYALVGIMQKKMQTSMNNGPDVRRAIIPYSTFRTLYGLIYINSMVVKPRTMENSEEVKARIYSLLGSKYHFDPTDTRALGIWDMVKALKMTRKVTTGFLIFMGIIGMLTLIIAGVGVANVMYVVVKERTKEIGIKMALGARKSYITAQFVFESLLLSFLGGAIGSGISFGLVSLLKLLPAESDLMQFLGRPEISGSLMLFVVGMLTLIGVTAGIFPARKAASVDPVESLRYE